jgi:hypothetical protein
MRMGQVLSIGVLVLAGATVALAGKVQPARGRDSEHRRLGIGEGRHGDGTFFSQ